MAKFVENMVFGLAFGLGFLVAYGVLRLLLNVLSGAAHINF